MLAHEGQCLGVTGRLVLDLDGANPLGALFRSRVRLGITPAILGLTGSNTVVTVISALVGINQNTPAFVTGDRLISWPGASRCR